MKKLLFAVAALFLTITVIAQEPAGLKAGDKAPLFTAKDQTGTSFSLADQLKQGPVVLVFYRGYWCPFCNKQLQKLEDSLSFIKAKGATLVAVTAEKPESISKTVEKTKVSYPVLYDEGLSILKNYEVAFAVDAATIEKYKGYGIDFTAVNGSNGANLPVPAIYVIGKDGKISWLHFDKDYRKRASVAEILKAL